MLGLFDAERTRQRDIEIEVARHGNRSSSRITECSEVWPGKGALVQPETIKFAGVVADTIPSNINRGLAIDVRAIPSEVVVAGCGDRQEFTGRVLVDRCQLP